MLCGNVYRYSPSSLGVYCFNDKYCIPVETVFQMQNVDSEYVEEWIKTIPLNEII